MRITFLGNFRVDYTSETHHAKSLEQLGHTVTRLQETEVTAEQVRSITTDMLIWGHTHGWETPGDMAAVLADLRQRSIPTVAYHLDLYMPLQRWKRYRKHTYMHVQHFFTVDPPLAQWLNSHTPTKGYWLTPGVFGPECYLAEPKDRFDIAFVGSRQYHHEWSHRPKLIDWLQATYGSRFKWFGHDSPRGLVRGAALNQVYADARVVVGDSLCPEYSYRNYWSDRVPETLGRGGMLLMPHVLGLGEHYTDREHLAFWEFGDFDGLAQLIDHYLTHEDERETIRRAGHELVKSRDTYTHRWETILETVCR